ncbi:MAG: hypothetical protein R3Y18_05995 [Bacillota bacterium]
MKNRVLFSLLCLFAIVNVVIFPSVYMQAFFAGLSLFGTRLLPVLFPFFVFCSLLVKTGVLFEISTRFFASPAKKLGLSTHFPYVFTLALLSGYPMNAKLTADLFENGFVTAVEGETLAFSTSCSGVVFLCSTVGMIMFESVKIGIILTISHILACLIGFFIYRFIFARKIEIATIKTADITKNIGGDFNIVDAITDSVASALSSILLVGAYVCVFSVICEMFEVFGVFSRLSVLGCGFFSGILEITNGISKIATIKADTISVALITALVSFGGLSINLQSLALLAPLDVSKARYFALKTIQMFCGFIIGFLFGGIL